MKNSVKFSRKFTVYTIFSAALMLLIFTACEPGPDIIPNTTRTMEESFAVGPEGGAFTALKGNVTLEIPKGALDDQVKIRIKIGPEDYDNDFIIRSIEIYPKSLIFKISASMHLKYDRQLSIGMDPLKAESLVIYHFKDERTFDKRYPSDMIWINKCYVDAGDQCIDAEIHSGGIFAIGEESLDRTDHKQPS